jgi:glycosyltransferase involved in cell wall biosynthesis
MVNDVVVSVCCLTYNHRRFIEQALDGFCSQITDFRFEILIHDDASIDGTGDVVRRYAERYPGLFRPVLQAENQWSRGTNPFTTFLWPLIRGRYVALCEGDDYWIDPRKLTKQVEFLDSQRANSGCFHPVRVIDDGGTRPDSTWPTIEYVQNTLGGRALGIDDLLVSNVIHTPSIMYRWRFRGQPYPGDVSRRLMPFDWYLHLQHAANGPIAIIPETMAVYRLHAGGAWRHASDDLNTFYLEYGVEYARFFAECSRTLGRTIAEPRLSQTLAGIIKAYLLVGDVDSLRAIAALSPDYIALGSRALFETTATSADRVDSGYSATM